MSGSTSVQSELNRGQFHLHLYSFGSTSILPELMVWGGQILSLDPSPDTCFYLT